MLLFILSYSTTLNTEETYKTHFTYPLGLDIITFKIIYKKLYEFILCIAST